MFLSKMKMGGGAHGDDRPSTMQPMQSDLTEENDVIDCDPHIHRVTKGVLDRGALHLRHGDGSRVVGRSDP